MSDFGVLTLQRPDVVPEVAEGAAGGAAAFTRRAQAPGGGSEAEGELEAQLDLEDDDAADDVQFEDYEPLWLKGIGKKHPDPVVENASLSAVKFPNRLMTLSRDISPDVVKEGKLSNLQLEAVAYANMCFGKNLEDGSRRGFFIGDGAGIGKGRELAGIVAQQWARGVRKHLWISVSNDPEVRC